MKAFTKKNEVGAPVISVLITQIITSLTLVVVYFSANTYSFFYNISAEMIMIPYLFSAAYFLKLCFDEKVMGSQSAGEKVKNLIFAVIGTVYSVWMLYSSGLSLLLLSTILYTPGLIIFYLGKKERGEKTFKSTAEMISAVVLVGLAVLSAVLLVTGKVTI